VNERSLDAVVMFFFELRSAFFSFSGFLLKHTYQYFASSFSGIEIYRVSPLADDISMRDYVINI
jgi:hypothetical protein